MASKGLWLLGVSAGALAVAGPVNAQQVPAATAADEQATQAGSENSPNDASEADTSAAHTTESGDIVVTARRRNELLQDVPIAVSALSAETASRVGITGVEAITLTTPNLQFNREISHGATPFLRGVGSPQASAGGESPVAVYVDDVYVSSPNANMFAFNNIAGVQVLKGPQGTLFGRNATGGVVQVQTRRPSFDPAMEATFGIGNYDTIEGSFYATAPLTDALAVNFAASGRDQRDGFGRSLLTGRETQLGWDWSVRGQMLWRPSDATQLLLIGDYGDQRSDSGSNNTSAPGTITLSGATYQGYNTQAAGTDYARVRQAGLSLRVDQETSFANLVSISAYRWTRVGFNLDQDLGPAPLVEVGLIRSPTRSFSQEAQVVSLPDSSIKWIVGVYYLHTTTGYDPSRIGGLFFAPLRTISLFNEQTLNSYAGFGEVTFGLLPRTNLTLGARYTRDAYDLDVEGRLGNDTIPLPGNTFTQHDAFSKLTYRAILDHHFTPDIMGYASYSRGFRSGGYQLAFPGNAANPAPVVQPEVLDAYEVGLKTEFLNRALIFNVSAFYYDDRNVAISFVQPGGNLILNAAGAHIKGLDMDFIVTPFRGMRITGGVGLLDGEYSNFPSGPLLIPNPATCVPTPTILPGPRTGGNRPCTADLTGNTTIRTPKFTFSIAPSYTFDTGIGAFTIAANYHHNSGFYWDVGNRLAQPGYDVVNGSISWEDSSQRFNARLWVRNLMDERYAIYSSPNVLGTPYSLAAPRTYGAAVGVRF